MLRSASAGRAQAENYQVLKKKKGQHTVDHRLNNLGNTQPLGFFEKPNDYKAGLKHKDPKE